MIAVPGLELAEQCISSRVALYDSPVRSTLEPRFSPVNGLQLQKAGKSEDCAAKRPPVGCMASRALPISNSLSLSLSLSDVGTPCRDATQDATVYRFFPSRLLAYRATSALWIQRLGSSARSDRWAIPILTVTIPLGLKTCGI
jgi:hypothetical protein